MRVAVITPYFRTPDAWLRRCHESVAAQTHPCTHILVADGHPQAIVDTFAAQHIRLPAAHADYGDTPRAVGSMTAIGQGFDAITYLDADNWYAPGHVAGLVDLHRRTGAVVCTSMRTINHLEDGRHLATCLSSDGEAFCDTNCLMLFKPAFPLAATWALMAPEEHAIDDRVVWYRIRESGLPRAHSSSPTLAYRATHAGMYKDLRLPVPDSANQGHAIREALGKWAAKGNPSLQIQWRYSVPRQPPRDDESKPAASWDKDRPTASGPHAGKPTTLQIEDVKLDILFASPLLTCKVNREAVLNDELLRDIRHVQATSPRVEMGNRNGWQSEKDLFARKVPSFGALRDLVVQALEQATRRVAPDFKFGSVGLDLEGWINVSGQGAYSRPQAHGTNTWSGVYYVAVPERSKSYSGLLEFLNPVNGASHHAVKEARCFWHSQHIVPEPGMLIVFPSYLPTWVYPSEDDGERISIGFNACHVHQALSTPRLGARLPEAWG